MNASGEAGTATPSRPAIPTEDGSVVVAAVEAVVVVVVVVVTSSTKLVNVVVEGSN